MRCFPRRDEVTGSRVAWFVVALLAACPQALVAQAEGRALPDAPAMASYADELLAAQRIDPAGPGLTVLVARDNSLLLSTARGMASVELGVPLRPEHVMRLGSITKQFAAATLLRLVDEGKAQLDDPLSRFLPDYPNAAGISLRQLLDHTSGIKSYTNLAGYMGNPVRRDLSTQELLAEFKDQKPDFAPGERWAYNNSGYVLVGAVIEAITGQSWHDALHQRLLAPAGVAVRYPAPDRLIPGHASGYTRGAEGVAPAGLVSMTQPHAAGALVAPVEALWRWNQALHEGGLLKPATYLHMTSPQGPAAAQRYGLGIGTGTVRGMPLLQHGGGIHGFNTLLHYLPQQRITVAVLRNSDAPGVDLDALARRLGAFAAGKGYPTLTPVALAPAELAAYEGVFGRDGVNRSVRVVDGQLTAMRAGGRPLVLTPFGNDRFGYERGLAQLHFQRGADGQVNAATYLPDSTPDGEANDPAAERWIRLGDLPVHQEVGLSDAQRHALLGRYANAQLELRVFLDEQGRLRGQAVGQPPLTLKASGPRALRVVEVDARLEFSTEPGAAQSVTLVQGGGRFELQRKP